MEAIPVASHSDVITTVVPPIGHAVTAPIVFNEAGSAEEVKITAAEEPSTGEVKEIVTTTEEPATEEEVQFFNDAKEASTPSDKEDHTLWRVTHDTRESTVGVVAVYPKKGLDQDADRILESMEASAGDKMVSYSVDSNSALEMLLTHTVKGIGLFHFYSNGGFEHFTTLRGLMERAEKPVGTDSVNHPAHYTQGGIECIDALDAAVAGKDPAEAVCVANVIKYVWRYDSKSPVESLEKAKWYLERLIGKVKARTAE